MKVPSTQWAMVQALSAQTSWEVVPLPSSPKQLPSTLGTQHRSASPKRDTAELQYSHVSSGPAQAA